MLLKCSGWCEAFMSGFTSACDIWGDKLNTCAKDARNITQTEGQMSYHSREKKTKLNKSRQVMASLFDDTDVSYTDCLFHHQKNLNKGALGLDSRIKMIHL